MPGRIRLRQGTEICNFAAPSPLDFFKISPLDFLFLQIFCVIEKENRPKRRRKLPDFRAEKKLRILSCLWLSWSNPTAFLREHGLN